MVSAPSNKASSTTWTVSVRVAAVAGPKVTEDAPRRYSPLPALVLPAITSTANVVAASGRWLTVTGTVSAPPSSSATVAAQAVAAVASSPKATARSSSAMVTVALAPAVRE